eukprot:6195170-Pleurochrysis_carterae.AAC.8
MLDGARTCVLERSDMAVGCAGKRCQVGTIVLVCFARTAAAAAGEWRRAFGTAHGRGSPLFIEVCACKRERVRVSKRASERVSGRICVRERNRGGAMARVLCACVVCLAWKRLREACACAHACARTCARMSDCGRSRSIDLHEHISKGAKQ